MNILKSLPLCILLACAARADVSVQFYAPSNSLSAPTNMAQNVALGSDITNANFVIFSDPAWADFQSTNKASWDAWRTNVWQPYAASNALWQASNDTYTANADLQILLTRLATNTSDRLNMTTNTLTNAQLNTVVLNILKSLHKLENLFSDLYTKNSQDSGQ